MKRSLFLLLSALLLLYSQSCDIIEAPYLENANTISQDSVCIRDALAVDPFAGATFTKRVFLEEMTGHKCGYCPPASEKAKELKTITFPGRVSLTLIHAGSLATFTDTASKYSTNFTTPEGNEIYSFFNIVDAVPFGLINRTLSQPGIYLFDPSEWQRNIQLELDKPARAGIHITPCYDPATRKLTAVIDLKYLENAGGREHLSVILVEDKVKDWQKDYRLPRADENIKEYSHSDVFRAAINGPWGQPVSPGGIEANKRYTLSYSYILDDKWDPANCQLIAYLHNFDTKYVEQVADKKILP